MVTRCNTLIFLLTVSQDVLREEIVGDGAKATKQGAGVSEGVRCCGCDDERHSAYRLTPHPSASQHAHCHPHCHPHPHPPPPPQGVRRVVGSLATLTGADDMHYAEYARDADAAVSGAKRQAQTAPVRAPAKRHKIFRQLYAGKK